MSTPPPTPPTKSKWGSRMGGVMRRASTVLAISRPGTPSEGTRDSDSVSLKRTTSRPETSPQPAALIPPPAHVEPKLPTPIAESPAREAAAMEEPPIGPSRLAQQATWLVDEPAAIPPVAEEAKHVESPTGYVPPPIIDSSAGNPGAFTDEPEALPQTVVIERDPFAPPPAPVEPVVVAEEHVVSAPEPVPAPVQEQEEPVRREEPIEAGPAVTEPIHSYFDKPMAESMRDAESILAPTEPDYGHGSAADRGEPDMPVPEPVREEVHEEVHAQEVAPPQPMAPPPPAEVAEEQQEIVQEIQHEVSHTEAPSMPSVDTLPVYASMDDSHVVWGGGASQETREVQPQEQAPPIVQETESTGVVAMPVPATQEGDAENISRAASFRMPNPHPEVDYDDDPFADPVPEIAVTKTEETYSILPVAEPQPQMPVPAHEDTAAILMPLPPFADVIHHSSVDHAQPKSDMAIGNGHHGHNEVTDERMPLLARPITPNKHDHGYNSTTNSHLFAPGGGGGTHTPANHASISPIVATSSSWDPISSTRHHHYNPGEHLKLHELGWLEYHLPDGTVYYVHPTRKVTTDVNLRSEVSLDAVEMWLDERRNIDGEEDVVLHVEAWLREVKPIGKNKKGGVQVQVPVWKAGSSGYGKAKGGVQTFYFEKFWVNHNERTVLRDEADKYPSYTHPIGHVHGKGKRQAGTIVNIKEDQLDLEYRYWSFMEAYPAHLTLPEKGKLEAMDVLTWAWTDRLLPSNRSIPSPFSQEECQELTNLLKSFEHGHRDDHGIQTRVVARILLRVAQWRQAYFRPSKPLPTDVSTFRGPVIPRRPFRRAFFDVIVSCLCLGIPYLFFERVRHSGRVADEESGLLRGINPLVIIGACTCLVAAIVLSASVTFLSLPGLDAVARTAGMVAVLFAAFTMVATGVSVLRYKADMERPVSHVGYQYENLSVISGRSMALSLPIVFLAYSVIGFVVGIVLYTFRGSVRTDRSLPKHAFEDYMRWTVVGVVGALAGIVTTSMILLRR